MFWWLFGRRDLPTNSCYTCSSAIGRGICPLRSRHWSSGGEYALSAHAVGPQVFAASERDFGGLLEAFEQIGLKLSRDDPEKDMQVPPPVPLRPPPDPPKLHALEQKP